MIAFDPPKAADSLTTRILGVVKAGFALAQSAQDVANAFRALFVPQAAGGKTLTLGTTAPNFITSTAATRYLTITEQDGKQTLIVGWR